MRDVAQLLLEAGHTVFMPTQTGLGERSHLVRINPTVELEDIAQIIRFEDLILVGHSFAGSETPLRQSIDNNARVLIRLLRDGDRGGEWRADADAYQPAAVLSGSLNQIIII